MQFQVGDVVKLKSGGPEMTVTYITDNSKIQCHWFKSDFDNAKHDSFPPAALLKVAWKREIPALRGAFIFSELEGYPTM